MKMSDEKVTGLQSIADGFIQSIKEYGRDFDMAKVELTPNTRVI